MLMSLDLVSILQHAGIAIALVAACWLLLRFGAIAFGATSFVMFCLEQYAWAALALFFAVVLFTMQRSIMGGGSRPSC